MTVMMILRVYAMWNQSRTILCVLLFIYMAQMAILITRTGIISNPSHLLGMSQAKPGVSMQSQTDTLFVTLFSSDHGPNPGFLYMRSIQHLTARPQ